MNISSKSELLQAFPDEQQCERYLENLLWNGIPVSPFAPNSKVYHCKDNRYKCSDSGRYFSVKNNTIFHNSKVGLQKWFLAIWLITEHDPAITSVNLANELGTTQKTAWHMMQRIKKQYAAIPTTKVKPRAPIKTVDQIDVIVEQDKLKMSEWLKALKR